MFAKRGAVYTVQSVSTNHCASPVGDKKATRFATPSTSVRGEERRSFVVSHDGWIHGPRTVRGASGFDGDERSVTAKERGRKGLASSDP